MKNILYFFFELILSNFHVIIDCFLSDFQMIHKRHNLMSFLSYIKY